MKSKTCCFTGHRDIPAQKIPAIEKRLEEEAEALIHQGVLYFGTGGARGFDTLAAQVVLRLKARYPHIRLILVLPCREHTRGWTKNDIHAYEHIFAHADKIVYVSQKYVSGCMQKRNRHLVDYSAYCVYYQTAGAGGTAYTVRYAASRGVRLIPVM